MGLEDDLRVLLNKHSVEGESNTPDFLLADYLVRCLQTYRYIVRQRDQWLREGKHVCSCGRSLGGRGRG